jgi:hypothetical protein
MASLSGVGQQTTIGVVGARWSAAVGPDASIIVDDPHQRRSIIRFAVASTDRWHDPSGEPTLRQRCLEGTPVVEHRLHVPGGDVVVTVYAVPARAGAGGIVVLAVSNDSNGPVALACSHPGAVGTRPVAEVPVEGIDLGPAAVSFPIGHRSAIKVAIPVGETGPIHVGRVPDADRVIRGWLRQCGLGARYVLADWSEQVTLARCQLLLSGPFGADPVSELLAMDELHQMGHAAVSDWVDRLAINGEATAARRCDDPFARAALRAAARMLRSAGQTRAADDALRFSEALDERSIIDEIPSETPRFLQWVRMRLLTETRTELSLFPRWEQAWDGFGAELHDVKTDDGVVSAAVRWHGMRPALLWDYRGADRTMRCPGLDPTWSSHEPSGEALLRTAMTDHR